MTRLFFISMLIVALSLHTSCKKEEVEKETGTVTDSEGRIYKTIKIGDQWWMAENLNVGDFTLSGVVSEDNGLIEKYCFDDNEANCQKYGGLYSWDEAMNYVSISGTQGICPDGWHIPTDDEVKELEMALGMSQKNADLKNQWRGSNEGKKLKIDGESGFDMLLSGGKKSDEAFFNLDFYGYFYTSTMSASMPWRRCVMSTSRMIGRYDTYPRTYALSVRCVKNNL